VVRHAGARLEGQGAVVGAQHGAGQLEQRLAGRAVGHADQHGRGVGQPLAGGVDVRALCSGVGKVLCAARTSESGET